MLKSHVFATNDITVRHICTSMVKNDAIVRLKVTTSLGESLFEENKQGYTELMARTGSITREDRLLGTIEMALTPKRYQEMTRYLFRASILTILAALAVVAGVTHMILKSFLGRSLQYLHEGIDRIANGYYGYDPKTYKQMEIESIISKFNEMAIKIEARESSLAALNVRLRAEILDGENSEQELRAAHQRLFDIIEFLPDATFVTDEQKKVMLWNKAIEVLTGVKKEEMVGQGEYAYAAPFYGLKQPILIDLLDQPWPEIEAKYKYVERRGDYLCGETFVPELYQGRGAHLWAVAAPLFDREGRRTGAIEVMRDITDQKVAENEMRRLRNYLSSIINSMPSLLVGVGEGDRVTLWNGTAEQVTGLKAEEAQGQLVQEVLPFLGNHLDCVHKAIRSGQVQIDAKVPRVMHGETRYRDVTVYPLVSNRVEGAVIRVDDVTDRVRIEEMMIQSEKMLSVGGLGAGMAHEINNPLGAILQASQNIVRRVSPDLPANARVAEARGTTLGAVRHYLDKREILTFLEDIRNSGFRAAQIVENMLSFSRKPDAEGSSTNLAELLDRTLLLAESDYDLKKHHDIRQIEIVREYASRCTAGYLSGQQDTASVSEHLAQRCRGYEGDQGFGPFAQVCPESALGGIHGSGGD
jgi:PAS domain S-box-containing protein